MCDGESFLISVTKEYELNMIERRGGKKEERSYDKFVQAKGEESNEARKEVKAWHVIIFLLSQDRSWIEIGAFLFTDSEGCVRGRRSVGPNILENTISQKLGI